LVLLNTDEQHRCHGKENKPHFNLARKAPSESRETEGEKRAPLVFLLHRASFGTGHCERLETLKDATVQIEIGQHVIEFDDADAPLVMAHKWNVIKGTNTYYAKSSIAAQRMHRVLLGVTDHCVKVDHRDGNGLNNQRHNLRIATHAQNLQNSGKFKPNASSQFKGVSRARGKFRSIIRLNGKPFCIGSFSDEVAAALSYDICALKFFGEFARPNFSIAEAAIVHPEKLKLAIDRCRAKGIELKEVA
jgi:hypothetical protein